MPTDSERQAARVLRARLRFCARISCAHSSCLGADQWETWMNRTSMFREIGLRNDEAMNADVIREIVTTLCRISDSMS
jgi:hypothetical protein